MSKSGVFSGPYFPVFGLNTEISVFSRNKGKYGHGKTTYLDTFHTVFPMAESSVLIVVVISSFAVVKFQEN